MMAAKNLYLLVVGLFLLAPSLVSASKFSTNCTLPMESTTLVSSANIRGTFDILWSGLFTIFICIWTVQHLNVPEQRNGRDQGWRGNLKWAWKGLFSKFKWMGFTLIFPEFLVAKAFAEMTVARKSTEKVRRLTSDDGTKLPEMEVMNWTRTHAFYAEMGGFTIRPYRNQHSEVRHIATADILMLREKGYLQALPTISADRLNVMSNGDAFTKAAAVGQVSWMVVQVIVRAAKGLPITQLEITACGFAASTFLTYLLWWDKPQAVTSVTELLVSPESGLFECLHKRVFGIKEFIFISNTTRELFNNEPMPNDAIATDVNIRFGLGFLLGGVMLGGVQCAAWNFDFPSRVEHYLWQYLSIVTIAAFPAIYSLVIILAILDLDSYPGSTYPVYMTAAVYAVGRFFILFETLYSLFHLPAGAFVSTWSSSIPHIA